MQSRATAGTQSLAPLIGSASQSHKHSDNIHKPSHRRTHPIRRRSASLSRLRVISLITLDTASCAFYMCVSTMCPQSLEGGKWGSKTPRHKAKSILIHAHARACSHTSNKEMSARWLEGIVSPSLRCSPSSIALSPLWIQQSYTIDAAPISSVFCRENKQTPSYSGSDG